MSDEINKQRLPTKGDLIIEEWKDIPFYEGYYQISNLGNIRSLERKVMNYDINTGGFNKKIVKGGIKPSHVSKSTGYKLVSLYRENAKKGFLVHRLVAESFICNTENKPMVNHKNGIKTDNRVDNLEWCTLSENMKHSYKVLNQKKPKSIFMKGYDHVGAMPALIMKNGKIISVFSHSAEIVEYIYLGKSIQSGRTCISRSCRTKKPYYGYNLSYISKDGYASLVKIYPPKKIKLIPHVSNKQK